MPDAKSVIAEQQRFSSGGKTHWIILRGRWGLRIDRFVVRWTGFSPMTWQYAKAQGVPYAPVLMVTATGARSGRLRTQVLPFTRWGQSYIIVGSNGGGAKDPGWVHNIRANGQVRVRVAGRTFPCNARIAEGEERERAIEQVAAVKPFVRNYDAETARRGRELPLVILTPTQGG